MYGHPDDVERMQRPMVYGFANFKDHRNKIEVPDLAVEDLISSKLNNKRKLPRLITQYRDINISLRNSVRKLQARRLGLLIFVY